MYIYCSIFQCAINAPTNDTLSNEIADIKPYNFCKGNLFERPSPLSLQVNRDYVLGCFLHRYPILNQRIEYTFEVYGQDQVSVICRDHGAEIFLDKDARKWATKLTKDQHAIVALEKQVKGLRSVTNAYTRVSECVCVCVCVWRVVAPQTKCF